MKFSDVKPGMLVRINHAEPSLWEKFHLQWLRNPNYKGADALYEKNYKKYETTPIKVTEVKRYVPEDLPYDAGYMAVIGKNLEGREVRISTHWFPKDDNTAFVAQNYGKRPRDSDNTFVHNTTRKAGRRTRRRSRRSRTMRR